MTPTGVAHPGDFQRLEEVIVMHPEQPSLTTAITSGGRRDFFSIYSYEHNPLRPLLMGANQLVYPLTS
jgi:hypothetical protein